MADAVTAVIIAIGENYCLCFCAGKLLCLIGQSKQTDGAMCGLLATRDRFYVRTTEHRNVVIHLVCAAQFCATHRQNELERVLSRLMKMASWE